MKSPPEAPTQRTSNLSPFSPQPVHFAAPSNIALLTNQMEATFDDPPLGGPQNTTTTAAAGQEQDKKETTDPTGDEVALQSAGEETAPMIDQTQESVAQQSAHPTTSTSTQPASSPSEHPMPAISAQPAEPLPDLNHSQVSAQVHDQILGTPSQNLANHTDTAAQTAASNELPGGVDVQALLDEIVAPSDPSNAQESDHANIASTSNPGAGSLHTLPASANLPPRPPSQVHVKPAGSASSTDPSYAPLANAAPPILPTAGAPGVQNGVPLHMPPPPLPTAPGQQPPLQDQITGQGQNSSTPAAAQRGSYIKEEEPAIKQEQSYPILSKPGEDVKRDIGDEDNLPWTPEIQRKYDEFLVAERQYVLEGNWEKFPAGSRLFLGNLPSEKVTKRDLFHVFHKHGRLAQISIKQAYGFVQYLDAAQCGQAIRAEQGVSIRGKAIHLEISTPGGRKRQQQNEGRASRNRRSRSPPGSRAGRRHSHNDNQQHRARSPQDRFRSRGDYEYGRQSRSPRLMPPAGFFGPPPPPPYGASPYNGHTASMQYRSPEQSRLPFPPRPPQLVPDVQVIAKDAIDRPFIQFIEQSFAQRGLRTETTFLGGSLDERTAVQREIAEGVLAILKVDRYSQIIQRFDLTVFDRSAGRHNVNFENYNQQEMRIVVELVLRAKQTAPPIPPSYPGPYSPAPPPQQTTPFQYSFQPQQQAMPPAPPQPQAPPTQTGVGGSLPNVDPQALQQILNTLNKQPQSPSTAQAQGAAQSAYQQFQQSPPNPTPDLMQILSAAQRTSGEQNNTQNAGQANTSQQQNAPTLDVSTIMAQLNRYGR